ncbi:hypothetical protein BO94DRAFT_601220 [Aspergillus sclerotioniger CBS 115572]|uniref:Uncharacterized protein n=1 Tax=Aspergillus sclerotioniger CBS 115572 TaxID=1450535 RepID=A0A317XE63_9EURO|nr:hypothetical protein BO94DRAFT_601220 [Aspergillus sclerotioniger CBS 115572]PWY96042.1 hypothetical protein BO94DRAFT_601220 [Aspergillus sclerotioniger CBS 115572]
MEALYSTPSQRADQLVMQRLRYFRGYAKIELRHLAFEDMSVMGSREVDMKNVERLVEIFKIEGCGHLEPEHRVAVIIDAQTLAQAMSYSMATDEMLLKELDPPSLRFNRDVQLLCPYGKHRLLAAKAYGEKCWLVELYLKGIPAEVLTQMREESTNSRNFKDGDIYRILRQYQLIDNPSQARKWWARFDSNGRRKDINRLLKNRIVCAGFDLLLPFIGLWDPFRTSQLERILGLRCPEAIGCYLSQVHYIWSGLFTNDTASRVDGQSVRQIEGLMPTISLQDQKTIRKLVDSGDLFPLITDQEERKTLCNRLLCVSGRILSLQTLVDDTCYLDYPARILRTLLPTGFKGSIQTAFTSCYRIPDQNQIEIQISEHDFKSVVATEHAPTLGLMQLWLFVLRHFVHPATDTNFDQSGPHQIVETRSKSRMALLASRLGFTTDQIVELASKDTDAATSTQILELICREEFYIPSETDIQEMTFQIKDLLRILGRQKIRPSRAPLLTTDDPGEAGRRRQNRPLAGEHYRDRHWLFFEHVFSLQQSTAQYPTSFAVTQDIIFCFFGRDMVSNLINEQGTDLAEVPTTVLFSSDMQYLPDSSTSPVELLPHPPGTPDHDLMLGAEQQSPLAAGFETVSAPLDRLHYISLHRSVRSILQLWYQSANTSLIVLFLFETRAYYKFRLSDSYALRGTLTDLSREHYFLVIGDSGELQSAANITNEALKSQLVFVGKKNGPAHHELFNEEDAQISVDNLRRYASAFNVRTGKRKRQSNRSIRSNSSISTVL